MNQQKQKPGLGRGLDALINPGHLKDNKFVESDKFNLQSDDGILTEVLAKIPVNNILPNPFQPRINFDPAAIEELKMSILANGLIQPVTVRRLNNNYQLISGERRLRACKEIGYIDIPAYIIDVKSDELMLAMALIENIQREKLNPIEIGMAYKRLMDECHLSQEQIADSVGKDRSTIANSIRLLKLPEPLKNALIKDEISMGHARALINLPSESIQLEILDKIKSNNLNVREVEKIVKKYLTEPDALKKSKSFTSTKITSANLSDFEDKLRKIFGTKVLCKQKADGKGEIIIEFYSNDELERLYELFESIK